MSALIIGVPSKGRLQENAHAFFKRAGISLVQPRGGRDYRGTIPEIEGAEVAYLSAAEIAGSLAQGTIHFGVTGEDLVREWASLQDMAAAAATVVRLAEVWSRPEYAVQPSEPQARAASG